MNYSLSIVGVSVRGHVKLHMNSAQGFTKTRSEMPNLHAQLTKLDGAKYEVSHEILVWLVVQPI